MEATGGTVIKEGIAPTGNMIPEGIDQIDVGMINLDWLQQMDATIESWANEPWFITAIIVISIWTLIWDGIALWHSARNKQLKWFIAILLLNTMGILEILYLKFWQKKVKTK